ncbi:hypothetical protein BJS_03528 [Bradyrhizobium japonicum SEMIA 5079]|nr:hypothetical protein BJS_03528 [Bradyrhizobium japonicum SEMIA 5079]
MANCCSRFFGAASTIQGVSLGPVVPVAGEETHGLALALDAQTIAVIFHFVDPVASGRHHLGGGQQAEFEHFRHSREIGAVSWIANPEPS